MSLFQFYQYVIPMSPGPTLWPHPGVLALRLWGMTTLGLLYNKNNVSEISYHLNFPASTVDELWSPGHLLCIQFDLISSLTPGPTLWPHPYSYSPICLSLSHYTCKYHLCYHCAKWQQQVYNVIRVMIWITFSIVWFDLLYILTPGPTQKHDPGATLTWTQRYWSR